MSGLHVARCCMVSVFLAWTAFAAAQSIDPADAVLALHRPFSLQLPVRTAGPLPVERLARCVEADFQSGGTLLFSDQMQVSVRPTGRDGWQWLIFEHPHVVTQPALFAHVVLHCPARFEREFVVQAREVPSEDARPLASPAPASPPAAEARRPKATTLPAPAPARPTAAESVSPAPPAVQRPPAMSADAQTLRLQREIDRLKAALSARAPSTDDRAAGEQATPPAGRVGPVAGALDGTGDTTPAAPGTQPLLAMAGVLCAFLPLRRWWKRRSRLPTLRMMDVARPCGMEVGASVFPTPAPSPGEPPLERHFTPTCVILEGRPETADLIPATTAAPGAASLADRDAARFTHQVRGLVAEGYLDVAARLLEKTLAATTGRNPWLMLELLELYHQLGEPGRAGELIGELQTLYRVNLPTVGGRPLQGRDLTEMPTLLGEIEQGWATEDAADMLEDLIHRGSGPTWDLATFQDLLLLHAIAVDRAALPAPPASAARAAFEPTLEWTIEES